MAQNDAPSEDGFEYQDVFYRWSVSDTGKDLMLIDRFAKLPVTDFFEVIEDSFDRGRAPILLALIATSIRAKHPDWTVERIERLVLNLNLSDVAFIDTDREEDALPPTSEGQKPSPPDSSTVSSSNGHSSAQESPVSATFSETHA